MIPLYETVLSGFRDSLSKLSPQSAYNELRNTAAALALAGFTELYPSNDMVNASDERLSIAEEHLIGRGRFDEGRFHQAEDIFLRLMNRAQHASDEGGFIRALHAMSRVNLIRKEFIDAEAGFRFALDYYSFRALHADAGPVHTSTAEHDLKNVEAALNCLSSLAETYFLLSAGPVEAISQIDKLNSQFLSSRDDSGYDFLEIRGHALSLLTARRPDPHVAKLISKAMSLYAERRRLAVYALEEAAWASEQRGISYPSTLKELLGRPEPFPLRDTPCFKPNVSSLERDDTELRHATPADAADSIEQLYDYLAAADSHGRYVYRGQFKEYDAPPAGLCLPTNPA